MSPIIVQTIVSNELTSCFIQLPKDVGRKFAISSINILTREPFCIGVISVFSSKALEAFINTACLETREMPMMWLMYWMAVFDSERFDMCFRRRDVSTPSSLCGRRHHVGSRQIRNIISGRRRCGIIGRIAVLLVPTGVYILTGGDSTRFRTAKTMCCAGRRLKISAENSWKVAFLSQQEFTIAFATEYNVELRCSSSLRDVGRDID